MIGEALAKAEAQELEYDPGRRPAKPQHSDNWLKRLVRFFTNWAWAEEVDREVERFVASANGEAQGAKRYARAKELQLALLEELFREKQGKIARLQKSYTERRSPVYEDMRKEQPIKDAESLAQSVSVLAQRANSYYERTGRRMKVSDGTVQGVPGDRPNDPVGPGWGEA